VCAIGVLMPFHSMTTNDSVQSISRGLAESPSEVLNPPSSSLKSPTDNESLSHPHNVSQLRNLAKACETAVKRL